MKSKLFILFFIPVFLLAYRPSYISQDIPHKAVFISGELDITGNYTADIAGVNFVDSLLTGDMISNMGFKTLFPFGIDVITGYDSYYRDISVTAGWSWMPMFFPLSAGCTQPGIPLGRMRKENGPVQAAVLSIWA